MANELENVTETVKSMGVKAAYGAPITLDGVEVVPVALVSFGFGGGSDEKDNGGGGGGGVSVPIGAYISGPNGPTFRPNIVSLLWVLVPLTFASGHALSRIIRALKK
ncbi:hypothetical protein B0I08_101139 [Glaciihabitans tibetensis]|uniref:Sporulation protein YtfJ n=1 Tax=Glaciihabitans tibetensis TaxID=1266600 RepID=A0A2T0VIJ9_9MICO|nr:hypothetical protein [Glaciihabitans tibetensis]PRY70017.1 hypothetical protein B0I08_101139 [Glaciihabitans tibetensis]